MRRIESRYSFEETLRRLKAFLSEHDLKLFAEIDHAGAAAAVNLPLEPCTVLVFGDPKAGTLLMQDDVEIAIELPLKVLVCEQGGKCVVSYKEAAQELDSYALHKHRPMLLKIDAVLERMVTALC